MSSHLAGTLLSSHLAGTQLSSHLAGSFVADKLLPMEDSSVLEDTIHIQDRHSQTALCHLP